MLPAKGMGPTGIWVAAVRETWASRSSPIHMAKSGEASVVFIGMRLKSDETGTQSKQKTALTQDPHIHADVCDFLMAGKF